MRIHGVELRHVRRIEALKLDLSAPLTVIAGPNGVGKTTLQQAILAAMFYTSKEQRESFVSEFDRNQVPTVTLHLSNGDASAPIELRRSLIDDKGEWVENGTVIKGKKKALEKLQETLPITAEAAALLLWGRQDEMAAVTDTFPADGHTLLTAATIRGSGADPKKIIRALERDIDRARKGAYSGEQGALIQAGTRLKQLKEELDNARVADDALARQRAQLDDAKKRREQVNEREQAVRAQIEQLERLEKLLTPAVEQAVIRDNMVREQADWSTLDEEIAQQRKELQVKQGEREQLLAQYRVARDAELSRGLETMGTRIRQAGDLHDQCAALEAQLRAKKRPDPADVTALQALQGQIKEAKDKMEATGVRYELTASDGPRIVRIAEDGQPEKEIGLSAGQTHQGIAGKVVVVADGLTFRAAGKTDLAGFKDTVRQATAKVQDLLAQCQVENDAAFRRAAEERTRLERDLESKRLELRAVLGAETLDALKRQRELTVAAQAQNGMTLADKEAWADKSLPSSAEIKEWGSNKQVEIRSAKESVADLEAKRRPDDERELHRRNLETIRGKAHDLASAFSNADEQKREPSAALAKQLRAQLEAKRREQDALLKQTIEAEKTVSDLGGRLKEVHVHRALDVIEADLEDAKETLAREQTLQDARALLKERIEQKVDSLTAHVPVELGKRVTEHLARLTGGCGGEVALNPDLTITHVTENGSAQTWHPRQLSYGERHQAALAVKVAVGRALAETSGPVFIMLDDSLVSFDPARRAAAEDFLLDLVKDGKMQIILLTCHTDWAADWKRRRPEINFVELLKCSRYYREPRVSEVANAAQTNGGLF